ncbi:MAG: hypothetical protein LBG31_00670 [Prevotellaceae bacterium]|nr:hypothetical protein [Prevotellaceae bacterium]
MKKTTTAKAKSAAPVKAKSKRTKKDINKGGWYMDKEVGKIPLSEYLKDYPPRTGPKRSDVLKEKGLFPYIEIVDMRAVMK